MKESAPGSRRSGLRGRRKRPDMKIIALLCCFALSVHVLATSPTLAGTDIAENSGRDVYPGGDGPIAGRTGNDGGPQHPEWPMLDAAVSGYRAAHGIVGMSVAVIHQGRMIYAKGLGYADQASQRKAHADTLYGLASVSKVIGGTLAARLEERSAGGDRSPTGFPLPVELDRTTRSYLPALPAHHTHTLAQLAGHLGCVANECPESEPCINDRYDHFSTQLEAATRIWDVGRISAPACTPGVSRAYSTPAYTLLAAALEAATGRNIHQLLAEEIAGPLGLDSMRAQFEAPVLRNDPERSLPQGEDGSARMQPDNSWKVLGAGLESSVVDLARFGHAVLSGDVVSPETRDGRLWSPARKECVDETGPACSGGIGWRLARQNGRRVVQHAGSAEGAPSYLRIYRDDALVVAILSNRLDGHNPAELADTIAGIVLSD